MIIFTSTSDRDENYFLSTIRADVLDILDRHNESITEEIMVYLDRLLERESNEPK